MDGTWSVDVIVSGRVSDELKLRWRVSRLRGWREVDMRVGEGDGARLFYLGGRVLKYVAASNMKPSSRGWRASVERLHFYHKTPVFRVLIISLRARCE